MLAGCQGDDGAEGPTGSPTGPGTAGEETTDDARDETGPADRTEDDETTEEGGTGDGVPDDDAGGTGAGDDADGTGAGDDADGTGAGDDADAGGNDLPSFEDPDAEVRQSPADAESGQEITGVRVGVHDSFDRVVLDLTDDEPQLGWIGLYEDAAYEDGSGAPIEVDGSAVLSVPVAGIDWTQEHPERYDGTTVAGDGTQVVTEVVFGILYEGQQQVFVGVEERTPFRIFTLADPARIVIDVEHP